MKNDSNKLPAVPYTCENGEELMIRPIPFGKLNSYIGAFTSLVQKLYSQGNFTLSGTMDYARLFTIALEEVIGILMLVLDKPREWFDTLSVADSLAIVEIVTTQNFNDRLLTSLTKLKASFVSLKIIGRATRSAASSTDDAPLGEQL